MFRLAAVSLFICILCISTASFAVTVAVGSCEPKLASYPTISLAVTSVPSGSTILVCPGNYPEQVTITQPLTLKGVAAGASSAAVISLPATLQTTETDFGSFVSQIYVQSPGGPVTLENLTVDASAPSNLNFNFIAGIFLENSSGVITNVAVRNQPPPGNGGIWEGGIGVIADSESVAEDVTIENSVLNATLIGVWGIGADAISTTIRSNFIDGAGIGAGIELGGTVTGTASSNTINGYTDGLNLYQTNVSATSNTIHGGDIFVAYGSNTIERNSIDAGGGAYGMQLYGAGTNVVESNTIVNSSTAVYGCVNSIFFYPGATGATVTNNTILNAGIGIDMESANTSTPNKFNFVSTATQVCPF